MGDRGPLKGGFLAASPSSLTHVMPVGIGQGHALYFLHSKNLDHVSLVY